MESKPTVEIECMHCEKKFPVAVRDEQHLEELLSFPVGECADCLAEMDRMTDEEALQELAEMPGHCICGGELDQFGVCKNLPYFS